MCKCRKNDAYVTSRVIGPKKGFPILKSKTSVEDLFAYLGQHVYCSTSVFIHD